MSVLVQMTQGFMYSSFCEPLVLVILHTICQGTHTVEFRKRFIQRTILISHQKTHIGEKPFKHEHCNKGFAFMVTLVKYQKICNGFNQWYNSRCLTHQKTKSR